MKFILVIITLMTAVVGVRAQDSLNVRDSRYVPFTRAGAPAWGASVGAGALMTTVGSLSRAGLRDWQRSSAASSDGFGPVEVAEYMPLALPWVMKAVGVPTRSDWATMAVSQGLGGALTVGAVSLIKDHTSALRPDGRDYRSFPSGHSAIAFMGATMASIELGASSPWYVLGAYSVATAVAMQRVMSRNHLPADVMAGAGIGILATHVGYYVGDLIMGHKKDDRHTFGINSAFTNQAYLALEMGAYFPSGHIAVGGVDIDRGMALVAGLKGALPMGDYTSLALEVGLRSVPMWVDNGLDRNYLATFNQIGIMLAPSYRLPLSRIFAVSAEIAGGYYTKMSFKVADESVSAGSGTPVGRVMAGAELRLADKLSMRLGLGYELSRYSFTVKNPSETYFTTSPGHVSGTTGGLLLNLSTKVTF